MERIQAAYINKYESLIPPSSMEAHDYPCTVPDRPK